MLFRSALSDMVSSNYIHHTSRGIDIDFAGFKLGFEMVLQTFPDIQYNIVHVIAEDEMVAAYLTAEGTQQGKFVSLKPTRQPNSQVCITVAFKTAELSRTGIFSTSSRRFCKWVQ